MVRSSERSSAFPSQACPPRAAAPASWAPPERMGSPLVVVFLAVIALTALLQAGFVAAIAFGLRVGNPKLDQFEETFETGVGPQIRNAARLTGKAAEIAGKSPAQADRVGGMVGGGSRKGPGT